MKKIIHRSLVSRVTRRPVIKEVSKWSGFSYNAHDHNATFPTWPCGDAERKTRERPSEGQKAPQRINLLLYQLLRACRCSALQLRGIRYQFDAVVEGEAMSRWNKSTCRVWKWSSLAWRVKFSG